MCLIFWLLKEDKEKGDWSVLLIWNISSLCRESRGAFETDKTRPYKIVSIMPGGCQKLKISLTFFMGLT